MLSSSQFGVSRPQSTSSVKPTTFGGSFGSMGISTPQKGMMTSQMKSVSGGSLSSMGFSSSQKGMMTSSMGRMGR